MSGRPIHGQASTVTRFKPAHLKAKDAVNPFSLVRRSPGDLLRLEALSPQQRCDAIVVEILQDHRRAIENRHKHMAAKAILDVRSPSRSMTGLLF
jgi:Phage major capsid protein E